MDRIDLAWYTHRFAANAGAMERLIEGVSDDQARWRPAPGKWSILEVLCHLIDEERDDFRRRVDLTLHQPGTAWPAIDPQGWAIERDYNRRDLGDQLRTFLDERARSVEWLETLESPNWSASYDHPELGPMTAGGLLAAWLDHDLLHIRQLARLHHAWHGRTAPPGSLDYAGRW